MLVDLLQRPATTLQGLVVMMVVCVMLSLVGHCEGMRQHCQIVVGWNSLYFSPILWMASLCAAGFQLEAVEQVEFASVLGSHPSLPRVLEAAVVPDFRCDLSLRF
jgi:hypothetical protein